MIDRFVTGRRMVGVAIVCGAFFLFGCATLMSDGKDEVTFNSNMSPVKVFIDGSLVGETPLKIPIKRKLQKRKLRFVKTGYETQEFDLAHEFNNNTLVILDITGTATTLTPGAVDAISGNLIRYSPTEYQIELLLEKTGDRRIFRKRVDSKRFTAANFRDIQKDIAVGEGEFLEAFADSFQIESIHRADFNRLVETHQLEFLASRNGLVLWRTINHKVGKHPVLKEYKMN